MCLAMDHGILLSTLESHSHSKEGAVRLVVASLQVKEHGILNLQCRYRVCLTTRGVAKKCAAPMGKFPCRRSFAVRRLSMCFFGQGNG